MKLTLRATDEVHSRGADTSGMAYAYGLRYKGRRGMTWTRLDDGTWRAEAIEHWPYMLLARERVF